MAKGRKAIPNEIKVLKGTDQPCRMRSEILNVDKIKCFDEIKSASQLKGLPTKRAKTIFKTKANQLIALGVLTELDLELLAVYANSLDILFSCMEGMRLPAEPKYNKIGALIGYVERPEIGMYRQMVDQVNKIGSDFGFTPISRQRINAPAPEERTLYDELKDML